MIYDYNISDFQDDCYAFNTVAGKDTLCTLKDIEFQYNLILEETKEIKEKGIDKNNAKRSEERRVGKEYKTEWKP